MQEKFKNYNKILKIMWNNFIDRNTTLIVYAKNSFHHPRETWNPQKSKATNPYKIDTNPKPAKMKDYNHYYHLVN